MQDGANEFAFKRKRKRLRTLDLQEAEGIASLDLASDVRDHLGLIPDIAALPELATSSSALSYNLKPPSPEASSENVITVEKFLRHSAQTEAVSGAISRKKSRTHTHRHPVEKRTKRVCKTTKASQRPRGSSRTAKTLFRAAVLTDGDPLDTLLDDAGVSHTRRPLKFVPINRFATPPELGLIVPSDPRREQPVQRTRRHCDASDLKQRHRTLHTPTPLCLVPFQEAEAAYSVMFP